MNEREECRGLRQPRRITRKKLLLGAVALPFAGLAANSFINWLAREEDTNLQPATEWVLPQRINGLNFSSRRRGEFQERPVQQALIGTSEVLPNLIGIKPTYFQETFNSTNIFSTENTPDLDDLSSIVGLAHHLDYKVMLAPQINLLSDPDHWHGEIGANFSDAEWQSWFGSYNNMILGYAEFAQVMGVELFVSGNELVQSSLKRPDDWMSTVRGIRSLYDGPVTYAAHHDNEFHSMTWASELDLLGLNPYYTLADIGNQSKESLKIAWDNIITSRIEPTVLKYNKKLIFPEIGYPSVRGASITPWQYKLITDPQVPIDVNEQAICYQALYESFFPYPWWQGVVWWNWDTDPKVNGLDNKAYSPRGKPAAAVIAYYSGVLSS